MHRTLRAFELLEPEDLDEAVRALDAADGQAKVLAGGVDLVSKMTRWEIEPAQLVSLARVPALDILEVDESGHLHVGAMTTLRSIEMSADVREGWPLLHEAVGHIASVQVKSMGTLVGNLCVATPASDVAPALCALDATMHIVGGRGARGVPIAEFFIPECRSVLMPGEIVREVTVPPVAKTAGTAFRKLAHTKACIAKVNVAVLVERDGESCGRARIALGAVASMVVRARSAEDLLRSEVFSLDLATRAAARVDDAIAPVTDLRSTAEYRRKTAMVLTRRAVVEAWDGAGAAPSDPGTEPSGSVGTPSAPGRRKT
jgi:aerobic carbon-monoxide dehydrogenase medium subunit